MTITDPEPWQSHLNPWNRTSSTTKFWKAYQKQWRPRHNLLNQMKSSPDISWNEKGEVKYKGETVQGSKVVDLVNDVLRKGEYFNPQGWETFGEALREANVPQDLIGHEDRWRYVSQTKRTPRSRKRQHTPQKHHETEGKKSRTGSTFKTEVETTEGQL